MFQTWSILLFKIARDHRPLARRGPARGRLDILINNAAIAVDRGRTAGGLDLERVQATFDSNLFGAWRCVNAVLPTLKDQHYGRIVNLTTHMASLSTMTAGSPAYRISRPASTP